MKNDQIPKNLPAFLKDQQGSAILIIALMLPVFLGFTALAVDVGHMMAVKAELQRTADAAVLAGAAGLVPYTGTDPNQTPNWLQGQAKAHNMISDITNKADNQIFTTTDGSVAHGYWLLNPPTGYVQTLPTARPTTAAYLPEPAITVTLSRNVTLYFAPLITISSPQTVSATATAILPEANSMAAGKAFAMAVEKNIVYNPDNTINLSPQDFGWHDHAQWFTTDGSNDVPTIRKNVQINAGSQIYIAPGAMTTLYNAITFPQTIIVPVVQSTDQKTWQNIFGFAAFQITGVNSKSIAGHFLNNFNSPDVIPHIGGGTSFGVSGTPKLVSP